MGVVFVFIVLFMIVVFLLFDIGEFVYVFVIFGVLWVYWWLLFKMFVFIMLVV